MDIEHPPFLHFGGYAAACLLSKAGKAMDPNLRILVCAILFIFFLSPFYSFIYFQCYLCSSLCMKMFLQ